MGAWKIPNKSSGYSRRTGNLLDFNTISNPLHYLLLFFFHLSPPFPHSQVPSTGCPVASVANDFLFHFRLLPCLEPAVCGDLPSCLTLQCCCFNSFRKDTISAIKQFDLFNGKSQLVLDGLLKFNNLPLPPTPPPFTPSYALLFLLRGWMRLVALGKFCQSRKCSSKINGQPSSYWSSSSARHHATLIPSRTGLNFPPSCCCAPQSNLSHWTTQPKCGGLWADTPLMANIALPIPLTEWVSDQVQVWVRAEKESTSGGGLQVTWVGGRTMTRRMTIQKRICFSVGMAIEIKWDYSTLELIIRIIIVLLLLVWMNGRTEGRNGRKKGITHSSTSKQSLDLCKYSHLKVTTAGDTHQRRRPTTIR